MKQVALKPYSILASVVTALLLTTQGFAAAKSATQSGLVFKKSTITKEEVKHLDNPYQFVRYEKDQGSSLNLGAIQELKARIDKSAKETHLIPVEAHKARTKNEFVRILAEYHLKNMFENSELKNWELAHTLANAEKKLQQGFSYDFEADKKNTRNAESQDAAIEENKKVSWSPKKIHFSLEPRQSLAYFRLEGEFYRAMLAHSLSNNLSSVELTFPEVLSGDFTVKLSPGAKSLAQLAYRMSW